MLLLSGVQLTDGTVTDLAVRDGRFVAPADVGPDAQRIDAQGLIALPGLVDLHTHLREPGNEAAETVASGTRAAARGGYTAVYAMANLSPVTDTVAAAERIRALATDAAAEVNVIGSITKNLDGRELSDIAGLAASGCTMFSDDGKCVMDAAVLRDALEQARLADVVVAEHAQDHNLAPAQACCHESVWSQRLELPGWPAAAESIIVARDVQLAATTGARLHICHVSTAESVEIIRWAKARGINVTAEVTPHHLLLGTNLLQSKDTRYKVNPPLRTDEHIEAVRAGLADGTIDVVATDHAPHTPDAKSKPFPEASPGMIGLEQALAVVIDTMVTTGRMDWATLAQRMSVAPARIARNGRQGRPLALGEPATMVLVDPAARAAVDPDASASQARNNPYGGRTLPDPVVMTLWNGAVTYAR